MFFGEVSQLVVDLRLSHMAIKMTALNRTEKKTLRQASRKGIEKAFSQLERYFLQDRWLAKANRYRSNFIKMLDRDIASSTVNDVHLSQYVAASTILHCADGWSLLGDSLVCHARGDCDSARHLGYYAELRAAISILATEGIGVFSRKHYVIHPSASCKRLTTPHGGHVFTWLALEHWADIKRSTELLKEVIKPQGIPLGDWLNSFLSGTAFHHVGSKWLKSWGVDIHKLSEDRESRNEASYRPTKLNYNGALTTNEKSNFLCQLWSIFEPSGSSPFDLLDRHLLRISLEHTFIARHGRITPANRKRFESQISTMLEMILGDSPFATEWRTFLLRQSDSQPEDPAVIVEARGNVSVYEPKHHIQVAARAALLLRVATGACAKLIVDTGFRHDDLEFWWSRLGEDRGLWENGYGDTDFRNLWADIEQALQELKEWNEGRDSYSLASWLQNMPHAILKLSECERILLWGLEL